MSLDEHGVFATLKSLFRPGLQHAVTCATVAPLEYQDTRMTRLHIHDKTALSEDVPDNCALTSQGDKECVKDRD